MFFKKTYLDKSEIRGIGLFAGEHISKGTIVYQHSINLQHRLKQEELDKLSEDERKTFEHYGYKHDGVWHLDFDDIRFLNHSDTPNLGLTSVGITALIDIIKGEELTQNYKDFEDEIRFKLL